MQKMGILKKGKKSGSWREKTKKREKIRFCDTEKHGVCTEKTGVCTCSARRHGKNQVLSRKKPGSAKMFKNPKFCIWRPKNEHEEAQLLSTMGLTASTDFILSARGPQHGSEREKMEPARADTEKIRFLPYICACHTPECQCAQHGVRQALTCRVRT